MTLGLGIALKVMARQAGLSGNTMFLERYGLYKGHQMDLKRTMKLSKKNSRSNSEPSSVYSEFDAEDKPSQRALQEREKALSLLSSPSTLLMNARGSRRSKVIALDLDQCSVIGEDTNDILQIVADKSAAITDSSGSGALLNLVKGLVNPRMVQAVREIRKIYPQAYFVFYTSKGAVVRYTDLAKAYISQYVYSRDKTLRFHPVESIIHSSYKYLYEQVGPHLPAGFDSGKIKAELERVGLVTWAASLAMGLPYAAGVYITGEGKDLQFIADDLHVSIDQCFLFDDKGDEYAMSLGDPMRQGRARNIITVPKFNFMTINAEHAEELRAYLQTHFDRTGLPSTNASLFRQASTSDPHWPASNLSLNPQSQWTTYFPNSPDVERDKAWDLSSFYTGLPQDDDISDPMYRVGVAARSFT